jgi:hypothetical protein
MRKYLSIENLKNATVLGVAVGLMAIPRILEGSDRLALVRVLAVIPSMTIIAGAVTAWGKTAGMCGALPDRGTVRAGIWIALAAGLLVAPFLFWQDAGIAAMSDTPSSPFERNLPLPATLTGCLALILWSAGFETLFFRAGAMSFFARVTNRQWTGVIGAILISLAVRSAKLGSVDTDGMMALRIVGMTVVTTVGCVLYARSGLVAAMVFAAVLDMRHVVRWLLIRG